MRRSSRITLQTDTGPWRNKAIAPYAYAMDIARRFESYVDGLLLDTHAGDRIGGTGIVHDWSISRRIVASVNIPVILAGGLKPENVIQAIRAVQPHGVDVNSGVEFPNGEKNPDRVREFIRMAKSCADGYPSR